MREAMAILCSFAFAAASMGVGEDRSSPVGHVHEVREDPRLHLHIVTVDLSDPRVRVVAHVGGGDPDGTGPWQTTLATVRQVAEREGLDVAVNANFFMSRLAIPVVGRRVPYFTGNWARPVGWTMIDGTLINADATSAASLVVHASGRVTIGRFDRLPGDARHVVSGSQLLLRDGEITARGEVRAPRTAAGLDASGDRLILMVVDGRLLSRSAGMSELELARELKRLGCTDALNLDGGGSSTLVMRQPDPAAERGSTLQVMNRPSDGHDLRFPLSIERPVACVLGVTLEDAGRHEPDRGDEGAGSDDGAAKRP